MAKVPTPLQKQLFFELLDLPDDARAARLAEIAGEDAALGERLHALLDAHSRAESALGSIDRLEAPEIDALSAGQQVGPYSLQRELGEGGFGRVWLAEQLEPVRRPVALKLLKAGMDTREVVARFQAERQALARMSHPGIAMVYDAGETDRGRPWFAMEFVDGSPITDYCDAGRLDLHARLELFASVCRAVQHAHTKGVVHRDLKPNNVLVTEVDGIPQPKVIDFGIAKAVEEPLIHDTPRTRGGQWMGTPAFMAPEQLQTSVDVDTRADVYSLGALLHVLLVGDPPFRSDDSDVPWPDRIRDERPARASSRVGRASNPARPGVTTAALSRELDWVIARCLEKEPDRRYDSAAVLGNEVERVMQGEPVLAGPPGVGYRLSTFVRRNRVTLAVAGSVFVLLFVALLFALDREERARAAELDARLSAESARESERDARQSAEAAREAEAHALEELERSHAVATLTEHMLMSVKPSVARGADTTLMVEMLERAEQYIIDAQDHAPETEADLLRMVGGAWWELGEYQRALPHLERTLELRRASLGDDHPDTLESAHMLGTHLLMLGDTTRAEPLLRECYAAYPPDALVKSDAARQAAESYSELLYRRGELEEALTIRFALVDAMTQAMGPRHSDTLRSRNNLAISLEKLDRLEEAGEEYRRVLELQLSDPNLGANHPTTLMTRSNYTGLLRDLGRIEEARDMSEEVLDAKREVLPPGHISLLTSLNNLGELEKQLGNTARAEELYREALELAHRNLGAASQPTLILTLNLGRVYLELERWEEAVQLLEPAVRGAHERGESTQVTLYIEQALVDAYNHLGRYEEALELTERALLEGAGVLAQRVGDTEVLTILHAETLVGLGRLSQAEPLLIESYESLAATDGSSEWMRRAARSLAAQLDERGATDQAAVWQERAAEPLDDED